MFATVNYLATRSSISLFDILISCFNLLPLPCSPFLHISLHFALHPRWELSFVFSPPTKPSTVLHFSQSLHCFCISSALPLRLSTPTPGSKVSCLTVNVLSFPQREAAWRERGNYSVLHSINLHCVTHHTHTHTVGCMCASFECVPCGTYCPLHKCVCVREDMRGHRASQQF